MRLFAVAMLAVLPALAQDAGITRAQADAILNELKQIRQLLERQPANPAPQAPVQPLTGKANAEGGYFLGSKDAPLTLIEYSDYECPFCRQFEKTTFSEIRKKYIDTGKLRFVVRSMPLSFHPHAMMAAEAALCAGDQGQFWGMHDLLFTAASLEKDAIVQYAGKLGVDTAKFSACVDSGQHAPDIMKDLQESTALQINGTPGFLMGRTSAEGVEGPLLIGAYPLAAFEAKFQQIEGASPGPKN